MTDQPGPGAEGYWEALEDGGEVPDPSMIELIEKCLEDLDEPEELLGAVYTGESDHLRFVLAATRKVRDGNLLITLRYVTVDTDDVEARTGKNRIRLRVQGSLLNALPPLFASIKDGNATPDDPMVMDARSQDGLDYVGNALTEPISGAPDDADPDAEEDETSASSPRSHSADESVDLHSGARRDTETCIECGQPVDKSEGKNLGAALGADQWIHADACPDDGGETDA